MSILFIHSKDDGLLSENNESYRWTIVKGNVTQDVGSFALERRNRILRKALFSMCTENPHRVQVATSLMQYRFAIKIKICSLYIAIEGLKSNLLAFFGFWVP